MKRLKKLNSRKAFIAFFVLLLLQNTYSMSLEDGRNYVIAALELRGWGHAENLVVNEAQNLSIIKIIGSGLLSLTSGSDMYDISFDLDGITYNCFVDINGRFTKKVRLENCLSEDGSRDLPYVIKHISSRQMNTAVNTWQRRTGKNIENDNSQNASPSPDSIEE